LYVFETKSKLCFFCQGLFPFDLNALAVQAGVPFDTANVVGNNGFQQG